MPHFCCRLFIFLGLLATLTGCVTDDNFLNHPDALASDDMVVPGTPHPPRALAMFVGRTGRVLTWPDLIDGIRWTDVVVIGEQHNDAVSHEVEAAIVEDTLRLFPNAAVSMEMFERDEQPIVDAYLAGEIDEKTLIEKTGADSWAGGSTWEQTYGRIVHLARGYNAKVIAANAPRTYVKQARTDGYEALRGLPESERRLFAIPGKLNQGDYRHRFFQVMGGGEQADDDDDAHQTDEAVIEDFFRAQQVWDATMGDSIAIAIDNGVEKVIHIVGRFHSDFDGGVVDQVRARTCFTKILTISLQPKNARKLLEEDRDRADVVIYTGNE